MLRLRTAPSMVAVARRVNSALLVVWPNPRTPAFFLTGVVETADQAVKSAHRLLSLFQADREKVAGLGKAAGSALRLHEYLQRNPITSAAGAAEGTGLSAMTCGTILSKLQTIHLVREITGGKYGRPYAYDEYLKILSEGTEPLQRR